MNESHEYILDNIETINFVDYKDYAPKSVEFTPTLPSSSVKVGKTEIKLGSRYVLNQPKLTEPNLKTLLSVLKKNRIVTIALASNVLYEDSIALSNMGFDNIFLLKYDDEPKTYDDKMNMFIANIKRLQQVGTNMAIFVQDIVTIAHTLDANYKNSPKTYFNHTEETASTIKEIVMLAKCNVENTSTLFITNEESDNLDALYSTCINKVSNKIQL